MKMEKSALEVVVRQDQGWLGNEALDLYAPRLMSPICSPVG